jgi:hypothetical protein
MSARPFSRNVATRATSARACAASRFDPTQGTADHARSSLPGSDVDHPQVRPPIDRLTRTKTLVRAKAIVTVAARQAREATTAHLVKMNLGRGRKTRSVPRTASGASSAYGDHANTVRRQRGD